MEQRQISDNTNATAEFDAIVIGAGFSGLGMLNRLRELGLSARVYEAGNGVGGTWHWNRYPGARTDSECYYYCYSFSKELLQDWTWSERYPGQPEMLRYLNHVADRFDLRKDIQFNTRVTSAVFNEKTGRWDVETGNGEHINAQFLITGLGLLSTPHIPDFKGIDSFEGETYFAAQWPHEKVDFEGKRVGLIGTGASGIQATPIVAEEADRLTVFQRTPNYVVPAQNRPMEPEVLQKIKNNYDEILKKARGHSFAMPIDAPNRLAVETSPEERERIYEAGWQAGGFRYIFETFDDLLVDQAANDTAAEFIRSKIRQIVHDPETAELLCPKGYPFAGKRPPAGHGYYETFNRDNVTLVDISKSQIEITPKGVRTSGTEYEFDVLIFATGFDAVTGSLDKIDIRGRGGASLKKKWEGGPRTYLGLTSHEFPNLFMLTGPGSPFANLPVCIEQNIGWIGNAIEHMRQNDVKVIEPTQKAEDDWVALVKSVSDQTLLPQGAKVRSWFTGANIPGKAQVISVWFGGAMNYFDVCDEVAEKGYEGLKLTA